MTGGGVIISEKSVLTTRSALLQYGDDHKQAAVWVGVDTLNKKKLEVNNFIYNNSFDGQLNLRDIAIVKLRYEMHFNGDVGLACLLFNYPAPNPRPFQGDVLQVDETTLKNTVGNLTYKGSTTDVTNIVETTHGGEHGCKVRDRKGSKDVSRGLIEQFPILSGPAWEWNSKVCARKSLHHRNST